MGYFLNAKHSKHSTVKDVAVYGPQIANDSALIGVTSSDRQSMRVSSFGLPYCFSLPCSALPCARLRLIVFLA